MPDPSRDAYPKCGACKEHNHETCTGCTECGCVRSAQFSAHLAGLNGGKKKK